MINLGQTVITTGLNAFTSKHPRLNQFCMASLRRHQNCDWGKLSNQDKQMNDLAAKEGEGRIISNYPFPEQMIKEFELDDDRLWIITYPGDHTVLMFPSEY